MLLRDGPGGARTVLSMVLRRATAVVVLLVAAGAAVTAIVGDSPGEPPTTTAAGPGAQAAAVLDSAVTAAGGGRPTVEMLRTAADGVAIITADEDSDGDGFDDDGRVQLNVGGVLQCLLVPTGDAAAFVGVADGMCVIGGAQVASSLPTETTVPASPEPADTSGSPATP